MPVVCNGWRLIEYPAFTLQIDSLVADVSGLKTSLTEEKYSQQPKVKLLARIRQIIEEEVPREPNRADYKLKGALSLWRRVKFNRRYRLFFRFDSKTKIIAYCWVNDEDSLRKDGDTNDPYALFTKMISNGRPPENWAELERQCVDHRI
jgi:toxin YhaV